MILDFHFAFLMKTRSIGSAYTSCLVIKSQILFNDSIVPYVIINDPSLSIIDHFGPFLPWPNFIINIVEGSKLRKTVAAS